MFRQLKTALNEPKITLLYILRLKIFRFIPDTLYLKITYKLKTGNKLNLKDPKTFNEKLQYLKLYDRNPIYTQLVDKYEVRKYIVTTIGEEYLTPLLGVYDSFDEIDFSELPNQFVLKCTHDSGGLVICKDKSRLDINAAKEKITKCLKKNYYYIYGEWPYKNVKPRIVCEKYMEDEHGTDLKDYRFFCFNGIPRFIAVDFNITDKSKTRRNLYDLEWNLMNGSISYPRELSEVVPKPIELNKMINLSKILSKNIPHVRVDFYYVNGKVYFGEMTFFHQSGYGKIQPKEFDMEMGEWIKTPNCE
ncbi:glycosyl transferase [Gracilibacillus salitolerans]|uniref:Glycosyl transferase n=1 Tax=Gracilibacillus salitolerans TaxID=2663022 RepID=A0A5Q2TTZ4_9BACI|nr:ATP-grasp fold amidoligase family protein [Gracilibacillus salitolerans]QGH36258.1 glycosyl transferase [Gracilibacillus salitolerans]